jgi:signal transduction histidine kinase/DNA-binding response OmpR family regulator
MESKYRVRLLIVDDKPDKAKALESIVCDLGEVVCVHSGKDALRCLMSQTFAVILLDVNMPIMDGFETAELIRKRETSERTPIIFITSDYDADAHRTRAYTLGAVDYILAPVIPEFLRSKVSVFAELFNKTEEVKLRAEERVQLMQEQMARFAAEAARVAAEDGERRAAFLSEASRVLASSLDYEVTLERVAQLTVPELCDRCAVNIVREDGQIQCLAIASGGLEKTPQSRAIYTSLISDPGDPVTRSIQTGTSELIANVQEGSVESRAAIQSHLLAMNISEVHSFMVVPLRARDKTFGALTFKTCESKRRLNERDLALAEDLARRAAVSIDNARLYKEAQTANRMKDEFLTVVSHELRTPLTPIIGWTRMLRNEKLSAAEKARALEVIERNAKTQAKLIEDLLDVSRIITGKFRLTMTEVDLPALAANSIDSLQPAADAKRIAIDVEPCEEAIMLPGDAQRLQQILWNLLSNAIKFTPENGKITVRVFKEGQHVNVQVSDTGKGIERDFLPFVFERFRQADSSTTRTFGGLGIGLAIVRHLVELHGGTVKAESDGPELGASFTVSFPLTARKTADDGVIAPVVATAPIKTDTSGSRLRGTRILVVDDEPDTRDLLTQFFEQHGAIVCEAASVHEALKHLERELPDVLISDIGMPGEDGYSLIRRIRNSMGRNATLPAVAITAYAREEDLHAAFNAGYNAHVSKPIDLDALLPTIEKVLQECAACAP